MTFLDRWTAAMLRGDFEAAWQVTDELEGPRRRGMVDRQPHHLLWDGTAIDGKDVLVTCEHGLGDAIQFVRYIPLVAQRARRVWLNVQPELSELCRELAPAWRGERPDVPVECMELAYLFRTTVETIPAQVPYLTVVTPQARTAGARCKVGLIWRSGVYNPCRSIPVHLLNPLSGIPGVALYSLQQDFDLAAVPFPIHPLSLRTTRIEEAAAAMMHLDLIISVDSMTAHLAGALARPVWTLLPYVADWRWMLNRCDSPWYPTMRLFRQPSPGNWTSVVAQLKEALERLGTEYADAP